RADPAPRSRRGGRGPGPGPPVAGLAVDAAGEDAWQPHPRGRPVLRQPPHRSPAEVPRGISPLTGSAQSPGAVGSQARAIALLCLVVTFGSGLVPPRDVLL